MRPLLLAVVAFVVMALSTMAAVVVAASDESIATVDGIGLQSSLVLDASGFPTISYDIISDGAETGVKLVHCNDPDCKGDDESIVTVDEPVKLFV